MSRSLAQLSLKEIQEKYVSPPKSPFHLKSFADYSGIRGPAPGNCTKRFQSASKTRTKSADVLMRCCISNELLWKAGIVHIAGVDEVGIGPLAGPVVAAAVVFPPGTEIDGIDDSKALDEETRQSLDGRIRAESLRHRYRRC